VVYSFGETQYYYDQFNEPYRDYPAPILAVAGNHDGMVAPDVHAASLAGFLRSFCADTFVVTPEAGGLSRTAQIQLFDENGEPLYARELRNLIGE
jgi:hypothetical protein